MPNKIKENVIWELNAKIDAIIEFLKENNGEDYLMYNHTCPEFSDEPDSNIIEYAEDIKNIINDLNNDPYDFQFPF